MGLLGLVGDHWFKQKVHISPCVWRLLQDAMRTFYQQPITCHAGVPVNYPKAQVTSGKYSTAQ